MEQAVSKLHLFYNRYSGKVPALLLIGLFCMIFEIERFQQCNIGQVENTSTDRNLS